MSGRRRGGMNPLMAMMLLQRMYNTVQVYGAPPVTILAGGIMSFLHFVPIDATFHRVMGYPMTFANICVQPAAIIWGHQYLRILLGQLFHGSDMHILYNMASFLSKGIYLERRYSPAKYLWLLLAFTGVTGVCMCALAYLYAVVTGSDDQLVTCAVGFSGVIFALKVVVIHSGGESDNYYFGFHIPSKYAYWAELVLIQVMVPGSSFLGHLAGIVVGVLYTYGYLAPIIDIPASVLEGILGLGASSSHHGVGAQGGYRRPYGATYGSGFSGTRATSAGSGSGTSGVGRGRRAGYSRAHYDEDGY